MRIFYINAPVDGWITKTLPNTTGSLVKKNEPLAAFYSPEFLSAGQALLFALGSQDRIQTTGKENAAQKDQLKQFNINVQQYRDSLRNLGMGDLQIDEMIQRRKYMENVNITSPTDGFILSRKVSQGLRFEKGWEFYRIADLSRVWILADVYGNEVNYFKPGTEAKVTLPDQGKVYRAKVSKVLPVFEPSSRTLKVRLETDNPGFTLRPDMFVDVELSVKIPPAISVPSDAVLDTGMKKTVFVDRGNGYFEPREVETVWRLGNRIEITKGLAPGERIVTSGTFLIDSESRMEQTAAGISGSLAKDPVSGMDVSIRKAEKAGLKSTYQQKVYYFASAENRARFEQDPGRYLKKP
jgi:membrane fusion protein, copper/silver efflux system